MREMDLILGGFIDAEGDAFSQSDFSAFDALLDRRDADLYAWVAGRDGAVPDDASVDEMSMIARIQTRLSCRSG